MFRRSRGEIVYDILNAVKDYEKRGGANKIKLLYASRLSSEQSRCYLNTLLSHGLLTVDSSKSRPVAASPTDYRKNKSTRRGDTYHLTDTGEKYLEMIKAMKSSIRI